jgi:hypothetical protein
MNSIDTYDFQLQARGPITYIAAISPSKWDCCREDWVIMWGDPHDYLVLPTRAPTGNKDV